MSRTNFFDLEDSAGVKVSKPLDEQATFDYSFQIVDTDKVGIAAASLTTFKLTLYKLPGETIINSRTAQDVLNTNQVTVDSSGNVQWITQPDDNTVIDTTLDVEEHIALFEWTWVTGARRGSHELQLFVRNLAIVV